MTNKPGSRLQLHPVPQALSVAVVAMVGVGSRYEARELNGISHYLEHMLFKGTRKRPTALDITSVVDGIGGNFNAFTSKELTGYYIKAAAKDAALIIDVLSDMMYNSRHDQEEVDRERGVILEEMNMYLDTPQDRVGEIIDHLLYPDHPMGWDIIGTRESLKNINREQLVKYNQRWYNPSNLVVSIVGAFDDSVEEAARQAFFSQPEHAVDTFQPMTFKQTEPGIIAQTKNSDQTHLVLAVRALPYDDPGRYALALLNIILGANMSSRLFTELREKRGLAYAVHTHPDPNNDSGSFNCQIGLDHSRVNEAVQVTLAEYAKLRDVLVSDAELDRAKQYLRGKLSLSLEDPLGMGMYIARQQLLLGRVETPEEYLNKIDQITSQEVQQVAQKIFTNQGLNLAIIGPNIQENSLKEVLRF